MIVERREDGNPPVKPSRDCAIFSDSLISQMYKQIVRQPSLTTSYGADVAKSFMASATRPEFGKKILRALETLNKKNALDRTMPELALAIAVLRQAKGLLPAVRPRVARKCVERFWAPRARR